MASVEIYSTPTCTFCTLAKDFFNKNDIQYVEHNVATDLEKRQEMVEKTGQMGVPVIVVDDETIVGFDEEKIKGLLNL